MAEEEEFDDGTARLPVSLTEDVLDRLGRRGQEVQPGEVRRQLDRIPGRVVGSLSAEGRDLLAQELAAEAAFIAENHPLRGRHIELAARRIGERIRAGTGEFSRLPQDDREAMIEGCPWC